MTDLGDTAPVKSGEILAGKYRVDQVLGVGGMGVVVAATHMQIGKRVALKFLLPTALTLPVALERFLREARAAALLRGEHVAQVLDVGNLENGAPYMVMEYLEGGDLGAVVQGSGSLPIGDAVDYVLQACEAVAEAHAAGIIHRDLKPRNLFLTRRVDRSPLVKVLDLGISKIVSPGDKEDASLTRTSDVMGSPNYMSPEQIKRTRDVDARTDIWSLGVVLYELLAGQVPFLADTMPQLCGLVLQDPPTPLLEVRPDVPPGLWAVILRCLEKDPEARYQSVVELAKALAPFAPKRSASVLDHLHAMGQSPVSGAASSVVPRVPREPAAARTSGTWAGPPSETLAARPERGQSLFGVSVAFISVVSLTIGVYLWSQHAPLPEGSTGSSATATTPVANVAPLVTSPVRPASAAPVEPASAAPSASASAAPALSSRARSPRAPAPVESIKPPASAAPTAAPSSSSSGKSADEALMPLDRK